MTKKIPFNFVLDYLFPLPIEIKSMFGVTTIYLGEKILLGLREKADGTASSNGIWIATNKAQHESLRKELPSIVGIPVLGDDTGWQLLPSTDDDFEDQAIKICELIKQHDYRIGNIPKPKKKKKV